MIILYSIFTGQLLVAFIYVSLIIPYSVYRERCEWRHPLGMVLSFCGLRRPTSSTQQVLFNAGQPGFPHICVWSVLSHMVLHHDGRSAGTYCAL